MSDDSWKDRARAELDELDDRIRKLRAFVTGPLLKTVHERSQEDMQRQLTAMEDYSYYLTRRLSREGA